MPFIAVIKLMEWTSSLKALRLITYSIAYFKFCINNRQKIQYSVSFHICTDQRYNEIKCDAENIQL